MKRIGLARIDDRLIHGQVVTNWIGVVDATEIYVVDNELVNNAIMKRVLNAAAPKTTPVTVLNVKDAIEALKGEPKDAKECILILTKFPQPYEEMVNNGIKIDKVILGGMGMRGNRKSLHRNIAANEEEIQSMKNIMDAGVPMYYQLKNTDSAVDVASLIK